MSTQTAVCENGPQANTPPSHEELVGRAREMVPLLRERADADEARRSVDPDTIARMKEAGLFRVLQSRRWAGYESGQKTFAEVQMTLAEGDMSVGWVYGIVGVHTLHVCLMDDRAAQDVWGEDSSAIVSSPYMPMGKVVSVDGGHKFSGRWPYSTGCDHCDWTFLGGFVDGDPTQFRSFLLPREDARIIDTWYTTGLSATGSQDVIVDDAFVPEYRSHRFMDGFTGQNPGRVVNGGILYRMPQQLVFFRAITNSQIGALQQMIDLFEAYAKQKPALAADPDAGLALAQAVTGVDEMKKVMFANFEIMADYAERDAMPPYEMRHLMRLQSASVADRCVKLAEPLLTLSGGAGVYNRSLMGRVYRNMLTGRQHAAANARNYSRIFGDLILTGKSDDILV
jgi:3-hydroxy-9,10-secoandrosta-1,3,5(10)-triene-9,17-dione monooxygenase